MKKGFTMIEVIIVVVILGLLAAIAIPKIIAPNEMIISSEGQHLLTVLLSAQKRWGLDNSGAFTGAIANLDVTATPQYFDTVRALDGSGANGAVASLRRTDGTYTLSISPVGIIFCAGAGCAGARCNKGAGTNQCNQ